MWNKTGITFLADGVGVVYNELSYYMEYLRTTKIIKTGTSLCGCYTKRNFNRFINLKRG
jgi:hypothetical protein